MDYLCASYNLSTLHDMVRRLDEKSVEVKDRAEIVQYAENHFKKVFASTFQTVITDYGRTARPHFICFQECYPKSPEKQELVDTLKSLGYSLCDAKDTAIAFATKRFKPILQGETEAGALFVDLVDQRGRVAIRIISDHVAGFNVKSHKSSTLELKRGALSVEERRRLNENRLDAKQGDRDLLLSIKATLPTHPKNWGVVDRVKNLLSKSSIDLVIYGLDANATASYLPKESRAHGRRLDVFEQLGFICDMEDRNFTIIDYNDHIPRKYDYLFVKAISGSVEISSKAIEVDIEDPLSSFSDHRPILATIHFDPP